VAGQSLPLSDVTHVCWGAQTQALRWALQALGGAGEGALKPELCVSLLTGTTTLDVQCRNKVRRRLCTCKGRGRGRGRGRGCSHGFVT
jgi:hypothetical protein